MRTLVIRGFFAGWKPALRCDSQNSALPQKSDRRKALFCNMLRKRPLIQTAEFCGASGDFLARLPRSTPGLLQSVDMLPLGG